MTSAKFHRMIDQGYKENVIISLLLNLGPAEPGYALPFQIVNPDQLALYVHPAKYQISLRWPHEDHLSPNYS